MRIEVIVTNGGQFKSVTVDDAKRAERQVSGDWHIMGGERGYDLLGVVERQKFVAYHVLPDEAVEDVEPAGEQPGDENQQQEPGT